MEDKKIQEERKATREEINFKQNPNFLYFFALKLMGNDNKELERLFSKYLKKSYDLRFWNLYIEYITKVSTKKVSTNEVYLFVLNHFEHSYYIFVLIRSYIAILLDGNESDDLIRRTYQKYLSLPFHSMNILFQEYEKWEISVNRATARMNIEKVQQSYNQANLVYQRLLPLIDKNLYFNIFEIELSNPLKLNQKIFDSRMTFIFNYYNSVFPEVDGILFLQSIYSTIKPEETNNSIFLTYWFSFFYKKNLFNFEDKKNKILTIILFLNWTLKNEGIDSFRNKFKELKNDGGVYAFIYAAHVEYYQGGSKSNAYEVFIEGVGKYKNSSFLNEEFLKLFLNIGDEENIRLLFKKLSRTEKMYNLMLDYEFMHGDMESYTSLLLEKPMFTDFLAPTPDEPLEEENMSLSKPEMIYKKVYNNFKFLDLRIGNSNILDDFILKLPPLSFNENFLSNFDSSLIIDILMAI